MARRRDFLRWMGLAPVVGVCGAAGGALGDAGPDMMAERAALRRMGVVTTDDGYHYGCLQVMVPRADGRGHWATWICRPCDVRTQADDMGASAGDSDVLVRATRAWFETTGDGKEM